MTTRPLTGKALAFAQNWRGHTIEAMKAAGFKGSDGYLAQYGSRLLNDPRVLAVIEARGVRIPPRHVRGGPGSGRGGGERRRALAAEHYGEPDDAEPTSDLPAHEPACEHCGAPLPGTRRAESLRVLGQIIKNTQEVARVRVAATKTRDDLEVRINAEHAVVKGGDQMAVLAAKVSEGIRAKRERERDR